jgi:hypothetical protein
MAKQERRDPIFVLPEVHARLKQAGRQRQMTMRFLVETAVNQYLDKLDRKAMAKQQAQKSPKGDELQ